MPSFPDVDLELSFVGHAEMRMQQRGVTEVDVRAIWIVTTTTRRYTCAGTTAQPRAGNPGG
jgi:hypothetical protein